MPTAPILPKKNIVNPNCSCLAKNDISSDDVINSAEKISATADNLMVDKLCVNEMKNIYNNSSKRSFLLGKVGKVLLILRIPWALFTVCYQTTLLKNYWKTPALNKQEPITWNLQLSHIPVIAFSQTDLFLVWVYLKFRSQSNLSDQ